MQIASGLTYSADKAPLFPRCHSLVQNCLVRRSDAYLNLRDFRNEVQKMTFFKNHRFGGLLWSCRLRSRRRRDKDGVSGRSVQSLTRRVAASKETARTWRIGSRMPDERDANTDAERGQIQYNHYKSKQIHSHRQSDCGVHCQDANQPNKSSLLDPNEKWVTDFDQTD